MRHKKRYRHSFVVGAVSVCSAVILLAVARWRKLRDLIHRDVCKNGFNQQRNAFVQYYGGDSLDAALLMIPLVGFLSPHDARVMGTVEAIQRELTSDGLVALSHQGKYRQTALQAKEYFFRAHSGWWIIS